MTTIHIARDPSATDEFCWFSISNYGQENEWHDVLDIEDLDDLTAADLVAAYHDHADEFIIHWGDNELETVTRTWCGYCHGAGLLCEMDGPIHCRHCQGHGWVIAS